MGNPSRLHFSLDLLKGFEAAARHLSFTRAADELSLTQSAISREIKLLESRLEVRLFNRIHRGLELTDAGLALYRSVSEALRLIDRGIEAVTGPAGGVVTITTNVPFASFWVVPRSRVAGTPCISAAAMYMAQMMAAGELIVMLVEI